MDTAVVESLRRAIELMPDDATLRVHLGELLLDAGNADEAVALAASALGIRPDHAPARSLMTRALTPPAAPATQAEKIPPISAPAANATFDWSAAEGDVEGIAQPMFVEGDEGDDGEGLVEGARTAAFTVENSTITLADVGGMKGVKDRLNAAFLAPLRNPELRKLYGKSLRGGLLMYGPPGCGKTFIARAVAGELGASFLSVSLADVLDPYIGQSERNVQELFRVARQSAPCVLFLDEIDALGQKRSALSGSAARGTVNQLLTELDGVDGSNEGVFVLAATNQPWDIDPALRRPGRLDRTVLVLPPDAPAREKIFSYHLASRPVEGITLKTLVAASEGFSGADIAYVCEVAAERALTESATSGILRLINMDDLRGALAEVTPSTGPWLGSARNVVMFGEDDGTYTELKAYLKKSKRL